jgi:mannan endo-1,4-beta-mannosidase
LAVGIVLTGFGYVLGQPAADPGVLHLSRQIRLNAESRYVGVYEPGEFSSYRAVTKFATATGHDPSIVMYYSGWRESFQTRFAAEVRAHGAVPFVQIEPFGAAMSRIADGTYDAYLRSYAREVHTYGHAVLIGFAAEMNGWWDPWGYGHTSPGTWVKAWRHVVSLFRQQGATNVKWVWTIDRHPGTRKVIPRYWPGAAYVGWVGIDGYYFKKPETFRRIFAPVIEKVRSLTNKPILISETGVGQLAGQARKIPDLFSGIRKYHLLGLVWFDAAQHGGLSKQDWRLEGHPAGIAAFRAGVRSLGGG